MPAAKSSLIVIAALAWPVWFAQAPAPSGDLAAAVAALRALPQATGIPAIAAHATPQGHWQFATRAGDIYTAGTPDELKRAAAIVLPDLKDGFAGTRLVLSQDSLFAGAAALKDMPLAREVAVAAGGDVLALLRGPGPALSVALRPGVAVAAADKAAFLEALAQLRRPLDASRLRILSASPGAPATLPSAAAFDKAGGGAAVDLVDPDKIAEAIRSIPRQVAILTARVDGANLTVQPASGPERTIPFAPLVAAAEAADVDLIVLHAEQPLQPGGRNWLWQRIEVAGLGQARTRGTLADFLDQIARGQGMLSVVAAPTSAARVQLSATPRPADLTTGEGVTGWLRQAAGKITNEVSGQVTGAVQPGAIHASLVSDARRRELERRLVPGLPAPASWMYVAVPILGLLAWPVARRWWRRLWPAEQRAEYGGLGGYLLARLMRGTAFLALFLPLAAIPAVFARSIGLLARITTRRARKSA
jgi:hypothetical protein